MKIKVVYEAIIKVVKVMTQEEDLKLIEVCDFGDSIGFDFGLSDKYGNVYWCVKKRTYELFTFQPGTNPEKYKNRKILDNEVVQIIAELVD